MLDAPLKRIPIPIEWEPKLHKYLYCICIIYVLVHADLLSDTLLICQLLFIILVILKER